MTQGFKKSALSEADIISKFILPSLKNVGWDEVTQIRQEVKLREGKVIVRGQISARRKVKFADIVLYHKPSMPLAVIEAKANKHEMGKGLQQGLDYASLLDVPFIFASNGDGFVFHDKTKLGTSEEGTLESIIRLEDFPTPQQLWDKYCRYKGYKSEQLPIITQDYHDDGSGKSPRYYQIQAISKSIEAIVNGQNRLLLVMATGTGKTYTAAQIMWRLWKAKAKKRILFLADRNFLIDDPMRKDFLPFSDVMTKITGRQIDPAYEVHLGLYQSTTGQEDYQKVFKRVSRDFFDLIIIDECHRGSASKESAWREILEYFESATQIGLTATPKETDIASNAEYFGEPIYTYSLKQGIEDGFLAPYKVIRVDIDVDLKGWRPTKGQIDKNDNLIEDRIYNLKDMDKNLVIDERTALVAQTITAYLKRTDPMAKTIVFCSDIDHAERMRRALVNCNPEQIAKNEKYVMKITGDDERGKAQLENFTNPKKAYPVITTTSELMTTGVDSKTCKLIVIDQTIKSITKFKQIIGRGTRIDEKYGKLWFSILDFKKATELFADERFDGEAVRVKEIKAEDFDDNLEDIVNGDENIVDRNKPFNGEDIDPETLLNPTTPSGSGNENPGSSNEITNGDAPSPRVKYHVCGVTVTKIAERVQYYDTDGKLVTESFKDYTRKTMAKQFASLDEFTKKWNDTERKQAIIDELAEEGIIWDALEQEIGKEMDPFDMICHVVYDKPPLTRKERAQNIKKRNYFTKYNETGQNVLNNLLEKYADEGVSEIENIQVLKVKPFDEMGRPLEIIKKAFGDKEGYLNAVHELENEIYKQA